MENLLNVNQVAFIMKVHPLTVRRYIREQKLKAVRVGGNVRIRESDLAHFTKDLTPTPVALRKPIERKNIPIVTFGQDDPLLRLDGRGASLRLQPVP
jgi:excisionase family DNA binding protein